MRSRHAGALARSVGVSEHQASLDFGGCVTLVAPARWSPTAGLPSAGDKFRIAPSVEAFHAAFDLPRRALPSADVGEELAQLRVALLEEEVDEFVTAAHERDIVGIADALADVVYVAYGTALTYGIDLDLVLSEVHRANMSKLDARGRPVKRADGKVVKSDRYRAPDVRQTLQLQLPLALS